jgi:sec-independent protein translocase protein TatC
VPRVRAAKFEDRLTLVEHLDELRWRIIISVATLVLAIALCFWQNHLLIDIANAPIPGDREPTTFGVAEPFTTTLTLSAYAGIVLALPIILYQAYAYVLPAFSARERRVVLPLLLMVPILFIAGVVFAYFVIVPAAVKFLLNFNDSEFNVQVRARDYYSFFSMTLASVGILFQVPVGVLAVTRLGIVTPEQLAANRKYAIAVIALIAMLLPGTDPVTMLLSMLPLIVLFEVSIILARVFGRPSEDRFDTEPAGEAR